MGNNSVVRNFVDHFIARRLETYVNERMRAHIHPQL